MAPTIGSRVVLTEYAHSIGINSKFPRDRQGTIIGVAQFSSLHHSARTVENARSWLVLWDGNIGLIKITKFLVELASQPSVPQRHRPHSAPLQRRAARSLPPPPSSAVDDYLASLETEADELLNRGKSRC